MYECAVYFDALHLICYVFDFAHAFVISSLYLQPCNGCNKEHFELELELELNK